MIIIDFDIFYRHDDVLASLHFNENVKRETHQSKDGSDWSNKTRQAIQLDYANRIIYSNKIIRSKEKNEIHLRNGTGFIGI